MQCSKYYGPLQNAAQNLIWKHTGHLTASASSYDIFLVIQKFFNLLHCKYQLLGKQILLK